MDTDNKMLQVKIDSAKMGVDSFLHDFNSLFDQSEQFLNNNNGHMMDVEESVGGQDEYDHDQ